MVVRKRQIIAAALVLALGSAVFINWYYNRPSVKSANAKPSVEAVDNTGGNLGDAQLVNSSGVSESAVATGKSSDYFASAKLRRNSAHDEAAETLNKVIKDSSSDASAVKEATEALKALSNAIKLEGDIEALIIESYRCNDILGYYEVADIVNSFVFFHRAFLLLPYIITQT